MDPTPLALLALAIGAVIGAGAVLLVLFALRLRREAEHVQSLELPEGADAVLQGLDDAAVIVDGSLQIIAASVPAESFSMRPGTTLGDDALRLLVRATRASGRAEHETMRLPHGALPSDDRLVAVRADAITPRLTLVLLRDITERERVEEMRRDFVANTSHELKTPVGAISLLAEAIESAADDPQQVRHFAARLSGEVTRLGVLTTRIMNLSRLQSTQNLADLRDVSIDEVVATAVDSQAVAADAAGIAVKRGGDRGAFVRGDAQILTDAIANLIANAIAYSPEGAQVGVGVRVEGEVVEIAVTDRGIGIPEGDQQRVFERFYRADQARSRRTGGTGLGLSIVKHAVQRHGGEVTLWSRPGRGSTFTVRLPAIGAPEDVVTKKKKKKKKAARTAQAKGANA